MQNDTINKYSQAKLQEIYSSVAELQACMDTSKYVIATYDEDNVIDAKVWRVPKEDEIIADYRKAIKSINEFIETLRKRESELLSRDWRT